MPAPPMNTPIDAAERQDASGLPPSAIDRWFIRMAIVVMIGSLAFSALKAYRAPITYDEACTYLVFARQRTKEILKDYRVPNNHLFHTLLVRASTRAFGDSPLAIRLPALGGALLTFTALGVIAASLPWTVRGAWLICVALTPALIDFNALARGYSLGNGFCFLSVAILIRCLDLPKPLSDRPTIGRWFWLTTAGFLLGLSVACVPVFGLFAVCAATGYLLMRPQSFEKHRIALALSEASVLLLALVITGGLAYVSIRRFPETWPDGTNSLKGLIEHYWVSIHGLPDAATHFWKQWIGGLIVASWIASLLVAHRRVDRPATMLLILFALLGIGLLVWSRVFHMDLPFARTLLFAAPCAWFTLLYLPAAGLRGWSRARGVCLSLAIAAAIAAATRVHTTVYYEWRSNGGVPGALNAVERDRPNGTESTVSIPDKASLEFCLQYVMDQVPRPWLRITTDLGGNYLLRTYHSDQSNWPGTLIWRDDASGVQVLKRSAPAPNDDR
jgi:hypothetical protein